jgi:DNA-binding SARP family transcriptional activator/predicted negative regulator of RcsB-dependent stress response
MDEIPAFRVLGPVEVWAAGRRFQVSATRQRCLLALLLAAGNEAVPVDRLVDDLWDGEPPASARTSLQAYVYRLRRLLARAGGDADLLGWTGAGYALHAAPGSVDRDTFRRLVREGGSRLARGDADAGVRCWRSALRLWSGPAFADAPLRALEVEARRLETERLTVLERCLAVEVGMGRYAESVSELEALTAAHPLHEVLWATLMRALQGAGRQADALNAYSAARDRLVDELGIEPGPELQETQRAILAGRPVPVGSVLAVSARAGGSDERPGLVAAYPHGPDPGAAASGGASPPGAPSQLPYDPSDFTGRRDEVAELCRRLTGAGGPAVPVAVIVGRAGAGKTALAVHTAHRLLPCFPDGQLYASLRGTEELPAEPGEVLAGFLRALGVSGAALPASMDERAALYRSLVAGRRMLVVLDDAAQERQVRPLLPGRPPSAVMVTGRRRLAGLEGATVLELGLLPTEDAVELLGRVAGQQRVSDAPDAARAVTEYCGRLPLAIRIVGARLAAAPHAAVADQAARLADEQHRLAELTAGDLDVRSSIGLSYRGLPEPTRRAFRLLGLVDTTDVAAWLLAALLDRAEPAAASALADLAEAQLLDVIGPDGAGQLRYRMHDLVRLFARERLTEEEPRPRPAAAVQRAAAAAAARVERASIDLRADHRALTWLAAERGTLVAHAFGHGCAQLGWRLAGELETFFEIGSHFDDWQHTQRLALEAARRDGDRCQEARARSGLAAVLWLADRWSEALDHATRCLPVLRDCRQRGEEARALRTLGRLHHDQGRWAAANACLADSLAILEQLGDQRELAKTVGEIGIRHRFGNDSTAAIASLGRAIALYESVGDRYDAAGARVHLACAHRDRGELDTAVDNLQRALTELAGFGDRDGQAQALFQLAVTYRRQGRGQAALAHFHESLRLTRGVGQQLGAGMIMLNLADLYTDEGRFADARRHLDSSLRIFQQLDSPYWQGRAQASLGRLHMASGQSEQAATCYVSALGLLGPLGAPEAVDLADRLREAVSTQPRAAPGGEGPR